MAGSSRPQGSSAAGSSRPPTKNSVKKSYTSTTSLRASRLLTPFIGQGLGMSYHCSQLSLSISSLASICSLCFTLLFRTAMRPSITGSQLITSVMAMVCRLGSTPLSMRSGAGFTFRSMLLWAKLVGCFPIPRPSNSTLYDLYSEPSVPFASRSCSTQYLE